MEIKRVPVGSERFGCPSFYLYMTPELAERFHSPIYINSDPDIELVPNAKIVRIGDDLALKDDNEFHLIKVLYRSGYRGMSKVEIVEIVGEADAYPFAQYHSEKGSLGISRGLLLSAKKRTLIRLKGDRDGRLYGKDPKFRLKIIVSEQIIVDEDLPSELIEALCPQN